MPTCPEILGELRAETKRWKFGRSQPKPAVPSKSRPSRNHKKNGGRAHNKQRSR